MIQPDSPALSHPRFGRVVVIGGANVDILGVALDQIVTGDSNPGRIDESPGGVGRNIAENLVRLGVETQLITALGSDRHGRYLADECAADGIGIGASLLVDDLPGSRYLAICDQHGALEIALSDMRALDRLTPEVLAERGEPIASAALVVADCNLPVASLHWLADNVAAPLMLDPVSAAKATRAADILGRLAALKLTALEAGALLRRAVDEESDADVEAAAAELLSRGARRVFVTLGERGVHAADDHGHVRLPALSAAVTNVTGAGDAFSAGVAYATLGGMDLARTAAFGSAMAALALESARTVSRAVSLETVLMRFEELL